MNARAVIRQIVDTYLAIAKVPADWITGRIGSSDQGRTEAQLVVDRIDADMRSIVGRVLCDEELRADAARRKAATGQRVRAHDLREEADRTMAAAQHRRAEAERRAQEQRAAADRATQEHQASAARRRQDSKKRADKAAAQRKTAARKIREERDALNSQRRRVDRIEALETEEQSLEERAEAHAAAQEAQHLADCSPGEDRPQGLTRLQSPSEAPHHRARAALRRDSPTGNEIPRPAAPDHAVGSRAGALRGAWCPDEWVRG